MASQLVSYLAHVLPLVILWLATVFEWLPLMNYVAVQSHCRHFILYAPIYAVFLLGVYAVYSVVHGVATFNDCADARKQLVNEIEEARTDLKKKKII